MLCRLNAFAIVATATLSLGCPSTTERSEEPSVGGTSGGGSGPSPAGSSTGGGGSHAGASGAATSSYLRIFRSGSLPPIRPCTKDAECGDDEVCFALADKLGICDSPAVLESTQCASRLSTDPDQCGCTGGAGGGGSTPPCGSGQVCRAIRETCSCGPNVANRCVESACATKDDCVAPSVCTPSSLILGASEQGRCFTPSCTSDADCNRGPAGRCSLLLRDPMQSGPQRLEAVACVYQGASGCAEGEPTGLFYANVDMETYYQCL